LLCPRAAFYGGKDFNAIVTHRVEKNNVLMGEFITKGDANADVDMNPVDYDDLIGRVEYSVPYVGGIAQFLTSMDGKMVALAVIFAAVLLNILSGIFDTKK
jgi:signal peptidase